MVAAFLLAVVALTVGGPPRAADAARQCEPAFADCLTRPFGVQGTVQQGSTIRLTWSYHPAVLTDSGQPVGLTIKDAGAFATVVLSEEWNSAQPRTSWVSPALSPGEHSYYVCLNYLTLVTYSDDDEGFKHPEELCAPLPVGGTIGASAVGSRLPSPVIVEHDSHDTWIGIKWDASGFKYDHYFINYELKAAPGQPGNRVQTVKEDDDGTWGYKRVEGLLPGRTYLFKVQGCDETLASDLALQDDKCSSWEGPPLLYEASTTGRVGDEFRTRWQMLDNNPATVQIVADGGDLYQLHTGGRVWKYVGTPQWQMLDNNPATVQIAASGGNLYQRHNNGRVWKYTGTPQWQMLDNNPAAVQIVADGGDLYQLHTGGRVWKYVGTPQWQMLDNNPATVQIAASGGNLYQRHGNGFIWKYVGTPQWQRLDNNPATTDIVASGGDLYQLHTGGRVWKYVGTPQWQMLDNNPAAVQIAASGGNLYQRHGSGFVWKYVGTLQWQPLDDNPATVQIAAGGDDLYELHNSGLVWKHLR